MDANLSDMFRPLILLTLLSVFNFNLSTFTITSINRAGTRSLKGSVVIGVDNKSSDVVISDIKGTVYRGGTALVNGKAEDVTLPAGSNKVSVSGVATVCPGSSVWIAMFAALSDINSLTADISCTVTDAASGKTTIVEKKGVSLNHYLNRNPLE